MNIQSTFHLPPKRASQHASPQLFRRQLPTADALLPLWIPVQGWHSTERTALRVDVSRSLPPEVACQPNTQHRYYELPLSRRQQQELCRSLGGMRSWCPYSLLQARGAFLATVPRTHVASLSDDHIFGDNCENIRCKRGAHAPRDPRRHRRTDEIPTIWMAIAMPVRACLAEMAVLHVVGIDFNNTRPHISVSRTSSSTNTRPSHP